MGPGARCERHRAGGHAVAHDRIAGLVGRHLPERARHLPLAASGGSIRDRILVGGRLDGALSQHRDQGARGHRRAKHLRVRLRRVQPSASAGDARGSTAGGVAMRVAHRRAMDRPERNLAMLSRLGSTRAYVGLFGTVWGIMSAFHNLGNVQQATLAAVAPGIAEDLIATAIGLFAAIPAVIAYNRYADQVSRLELRFDTFVEEFSTILQRHGPAPARAAQK